MTSSHGIWIVCVMSCHVIHIYISTNLATMRVKPYSVLIIIMMMMMMIGLLPPYSLQLIITTTIIPIIPVAYQNGTGYRPIIKIRK